MFPDFAGWQALNLAGLTEDRIERVVSRLPDDMFPLDAISVELNRVFASVHMSEHVSSTLAIPPGRAWSLNERERVPRNPRHHHRWGQSRPTFAAERTQNHSASSAQWDTFGEVVDTEDEDNDGSDTIDPGDLQEYVRDELEVLATCMDNGENDAPIPGVDNSQLETACLKLAELPEALAIVQAARRLIVIFYVTLAVFGDSAQPCTIGCLFVTACRGEVATHAATFCPLVEKTP